MGFNGVGTLPNRRGEGSNAPIEMFITAANHPADPRKEGRAGCVLYIRHFVSLSVRSTAPGTNRRDKSAHVDFSLERRVVSKMIGWDPRRLLL